MVPRSKMQEWNEVRLGRWAGDAGLGSHSPTLDPKCNINDKYL